jgi:hypothetical protein
LFAVLHELSGGAKKGDSKKTLGLFLYVPSIWGGGYKGKVGLEDSQSVACTHYTRLKGTRVFHIHICIYFPVNSSSIDQYLSQVQLANLQESKHW